jgi:hypothetical protein
VRLVEKPFELASVEFLAGIGEKRDPVRAVGFPADLIGEGGERVAHD